MLLATRALGLGTTLTTRHTGYGKEVDAIFGLPSGVHSYAILPAGRWVGSARWAAGRSRMSSFKISGANIEGFNHTEGCRLSRRSGGDRQFESGFPPAVSRTNSYFIAAMAARIQPFVSSFEIQHLIGMDRCYKILSWPWSGLDPLRRSMKMQVLRIVFPICSKAMRDGTLEREIACERERERVLEELSREFAARGA